MFTTFSIPIPTYVVIGLIILGLVGGGLALYNILSLKRDQRQRELNEAKDLEELDDYLERLNDIRPQ